MDDRITPLEEPAQDASGAPELVTVTDVCFKPGGKVYFFDPGKFILRVGDHVIISTARGNEFGYVNASNHVIPRSELVSELRPVIRLATETDEQIAASNRRLEKQAMTVCQQRIDALGLEMQLVSAEVVFDGSKILFFFTADNRVDFRELVKNLAAVFRTRIELRQIGVRDEARMIGGLGICGRPFCCGEFLNDFQPVSIKMAKSQNLSLNPAKISGTCGRLMCCLKYEQDAYEDLLKRCPKMESFVDTPEGRGTVTEIDLLRESVKVRMEAAPDELRTFRNDEIVILRSGKAKKSDPVIPDDLAPVSGGILKPQRTLTETMEEPLPEVRLNGEAIGERLSVLEQKEATLPTEEARHYNRRKRGSRSGKPVNNNRVEAEPHAAPVQKEKPAQSHPKPAPQRTQAQSTETSAADGELKKRRRRGGRNHHRYGNGGKRDNAES